MGSKRKRSHHDTPQTAPASKKTKNKLPDKAASKKSTAVSTPLDTSPFQDHPKGLLSKREAKLYDILSSEDSEERLHAANAIVIGLLGGNGVLEPTLQRHLERNLFRGLASGRKAARLGRGIALTEILRQLFGTERLAQKKYPGLTFDVVLDILIAKTKPNGDLAGQEEKDHFVGLLFGLQSFVRAKILCEEDNSWSAILEKLTELAKKKPWIREECGWVIMEALAQMRQSQAEQTLQVLHDAGLANTPEGVGIFMTARDRFPGLKVPSKPWGPTGNPLDRLQSLAKALKESSHDDGSKTQEAKLTGNWNPKLHFVWDTVLVQFANAHREKGVGMPDFENFWKVAVDDNLFSATASSERKYWGFLLFQKVIRDPNSYFKLFPSIFSHNLVRCLINQMQQKDRFLNRIAGKSLRVLVQTAESHPYTIPTILSRLMGRNGTYNFDKATKTKTISQILSMTSETDAKEVLDILAAPALRIESPDAEMRRQLLAEYIVAMIRVVNIAEKPQQSNWIEEAALPMVASIAYGKDDAYTPPVSEKTRNRFRTSLMSIFTHVLSDFEGFSYSCNLLLSFTPDAVSMDEEITREKDEALSIMRKLLKKGKSENSELKSPRQALALLYSLVIIQLYNGEPDAVSVLEELKLCRDKLVKHGDTRDSDVDASEVLVELLLSFISKPSALLRKATQHVFSAFMEKVTAGGLKLMTDVLESSESLRGQQELFDAEPEDDEQMHLDDVEDLDSDVEVVDMDGEAGPLNGYLNSSSDENSVTDSDDSESGSEDSGEDPEDDALNTALAQVLGTRTLDTSAEAAESDSDADMTDSEMMALDSKLVEIFSQRKKAPNKKQEQKDAKETMVNFKSRVLDLLDIYVKKQAANPIAFSLLLPLLHLIRTTRAKQLADKAFSIIQAFFKSFKAAKKVDTSSIPSSIQTTAVQLELLNAIHLEVSKDPSHMFSKASSTASLLVASSLHHADKQNVQDIATVYRDSQVRWLRGEAKIQASFFVEWINWCQSLARS